MTKDEALEKIRKLLATNGRTHDEANTAQIIAAAIAEKHGIDIAQVDQAEDNRRNQIGHEFFGTWGTTPAEARYAAAILKRFFEVTPVTISGYHVERMALVGTEHHIKIATHVGEFLLREFRWQWNHKRGRCKKRTQFIYGCFCALYDKLDDRFAQPARPGSADLVVNWAAKRDEYILRVFGKTTSSSVAPKEKGAAAMYHGLRAGADIEINPAVEGGNNRRPDLLADSNRKLLAL